MPRLPRLHFWPPRLQRPECRWRPACCRAALLGSVDTSAALAGVCSSGGRLNVAKAVASLLGQPTPTYTRKWKGVVWDSLRHSMPALPPKHP